MEEILKQIEEKGLSIELWDSIEDSYEGNSTKITIIKEYDISNIYWHIVNTDPKLLKAGNTQYMMNERIKKTRKDLEKIIDSDIKSVDLYDIWIKMDNVYTKPERIEYIKRLIDSGKYIEINEEMHIHLEGQEKDLYKQIIDYKKEKKQVFTAKEALRETAKGDIENINTVLENGIVMNYEDLMLIHNQFKRLEKNGNFEYTKEIKDKLFHTFIKDNTLSKELIFNNELIDLYNIDVIKKAISNGINISDRVIFSYILDDDTGNVVSKDINGEERLSLIQLKLDSNLPLSEREILWCATTGIDMTSIVKRHIQNNGSITKDNIKYIKDDNEKKQLLIDNAQNIKGIDDILDSTYLTTHGESAEQIRDMIYKSYLTKAKNIHVHDVATICSKINFKDNEEKLSILLSYLNNIKDNSDNYNVFRLGPLMHVMQDSLIFDKEKLRIRCAQLGLPMEQDDISLIRSPKIRCDRIIRDLKKGDFSVHLSHSKLQGMSNEQRYQILSAAIENGYKVDDAFWDCYPTNEERKRAIKEYVAKRGTLDLTENNFAIEAFESEDEKLEIIKGNILNWAKQYSMGAIGTILNGLSDEGIIKLINIKDDYESNITCSSFQYVTDLDKRIVGVLDFLQKKENHEAVEMGKELKSIIEKHAQNIESKQNEKYKDELQFKLSRLKQIISETLMSSENFVSMYSKETYYKILEWDKKNIIPEEIIFHKVRADKVEEFDYKIWNNLVKGVNKDLKDEEKGALVEIAYVFGLFNKDLKVARGIAKKDEEMTDEEKIQKSAWENYEARKLNVIKFINSLESTDMLHEIFDGMGMEFNPKFYHFFMLNKDDIINNIELVEDQSQLNGISMGKIQSELKHIYRYIDRIEEVYRTGTPTISQCTNYLIQLKKDIMDSKYENIQEGNNYLARLCALSGCDQSKFEQYQEIFNKSKTRDYSSIPRIKAEKKIEIIKEDESKKVTVEKNKTGNDQLKIETSDKKISFEILRMDDPRATVCGEKIFSDCCQSIGGAGESCLKHSQESRNGGILEIKTEDGTFLGQSWCWVNGNVLCFDSAELKGLDQNKNMSDKEKEEYLSMIKIGYEQMAKRMLEESNKKVEEYIKQQKAKAVLEYGKDSYEYKKREEEIEKVADNIRIKQVTIGQGFWTISKKLSEMYEVDKKKKIVTREDEQAPTPIENVSYINDSRIQYELARIEGIEEKEIKTDMTLEEQQHLYKDTRRIIKQSRSIDRDVIAKIKKIEALAHKDNMQMMQDMDVTYDKDPGYDLARMYGVQKENLKVICGEDWYYVYSDHDDQIVIHDAARTPDARIDGEENISGAEVVEAFYDIMDESFKSGKPLKAQLREDTSYALYLKMLRKGQLEQIGEENVYDFNTGRHIQYSQEEQELLEERLKDTDERKKLADKESTVMHEIICTVTPKGKKMIDRMKSKDDIEL